MQIRDSGQIFNDSYEVQESMSGSFIHVNPLTTSSQQANYNEISSDLADYISNLYRLLDLRNDEGSNGIVDKIIISKEYLRKLCNDMVPSSFESISEIDYTELNSISFRLIGCYGNRNLIAKFLLSRNIIDQKLYDSLTASVSIGDTNQPSLRPGIYLSIVNSNLGLIIHWPEIGCYENASNDSSPIKRNMVNLHRYLTKLTDHQMCFMSDKDLENFDLNLENSCNNSDDDDDIHYRFEVKKSQEEKDDFKIDNGFKVNLSNEIKIEINNQMEDDVPLNPIVVESTTNQSFVTRQLIKKTWNLKRKTSYISAKQFPDDLETKLQDRYLLIDRNRMDMKALELFVKHGLKMEELLIPLHEKISAAKMRNKLKMIQEKSAIDEDFKIIQQMASIKLCVFESNFDKCIIQDSSLSQTNMSDTVFERIRTKYPEIENQIKKEIKINSKNWNIMKKRYNLTYTFIEDILEKVNEAGDYDYGITESYVVKTFRNMFTDDETDLKKLLEKYTQQIQSKFNWTPSDSKFDKAMRWVLGDPNINKAKQKTKDKSDEEFIQELVKFELFKGNDDIKELIINTFFEEYNKWKKNDFPENLQKILNNTRNNKLIEDKLKREYEEEEKIIEKNMFEKICNEIEIKYKDGSMRLIVLNVKKSFAYFVVEYDIEELQPNQLQITIYETSLKEEDKLQIQENESHIPCPILLSNMNQYGISFRIDPQYYDFKKISQFDKRKFLLVLYNKKMQRIEIFFDTAQPLAQNFKSHSTIKPFKILNTDENFITAINEPKGFLAIYNTKEVKFDVFSFDDNRSILYGRNANIQLLQWYNNSIPNIKYFLFIKDTEELCFVENNGRARIFNVITRQFRPAVCNFPFNLVNVLSSPDGSCIMAFVEVRPEEADSIIFTGNKEHQDYNEIKKINRVYVYFSENFGGSVSKVIDLPSNFKSLESLQISCINDRQTHLISLDLQNGCLNSLLVKLTLEKAQFRFQKCMQKKSPTLQRTNLNDLINAYKLMFEKYPIDNCIDPKQSRPLSLKIVLDIDDDVEDYDEKFEEYITKMFENLKDSTKKPASILKKFSTSVITFQELDVEDANFQKKFSSEYQLGEWIIQLCCLIPIQIAVTRNNLFQPLKDGLSSNENYLIELEDGRHVNIISKNISFGWYEGIFKHFGNKKVKVISSMGEQSCGKSFMLNHIVGTTFDGSAMRCTEGVWMSLVNTQECIYVALDFEGLKSLERTPQEDMFLALFNTVVSNLILFKNQFTINRDISMFQKFQDGAKLFESDPKIFQARLCVIIKDVPKVDRNGITREFQSKFDQLVSKEGEDNFITRMYGNGLDIIPWPVFGDTAWFKKLSIFKTTLDKLETKYENARAFLQNTKVIMAKLKICDWGSLDENLIQIRVATLKRLFPIAVSYGIEQKDSIIEHLVNHDSGEPIDDPIINLCDVLNNLEKSTKLLPDSNIWLYDNKYETCIQLSNKLRNYFEEIVQPRRESSDDNEWFSNLDRFFKYIIGRRTSRVQNWYMQNTAKFPQDNSDVVNGKYEMEQEISKLSLLWTLCGLTCHQCGLKCVKNRDHKENHDCLTDHKCHFFCHFTEAHNDNLIPKCSHKAGHEGKHACDKISHLCGKPCSLDDKRNCQKVCSKEIEHDDDEHLCQSKRHYCGKDCSLSASTPKGVYQCPNKCIISYEEEHDSHRCENTICPIQCPIPNCKERCQSDDHFHAFSEVNHFCGNEHQCRELCEDKGICQVVTEPKEQEETYKGLVEETSITFTKYIQLSERLKCNKKIPPNEFKHTGKHTHKENGFHYCDTKCQFCEYYCTLPYGHTQQTHDTRHGNMTQTEFTGEDNEFEYAGYKLRVGDQGTFVLCNLFCKDLGRHRHIDYCQNAENCKLGNQGQDIQHINENVLPNPNEPKDFISHKLFWKRTGFKDPYSVQDQQEFEKCDYECPDDKHHNSDTKFCELQLFHAPLNPSSSPPINYGYISLDGHHFNCENPNAAFHIILVLDRSASMSMQDIKPIPGFLIYDDLKKKHNNRIGAVYQAVYSFMDARRNSAQITIPDSISLILFNNWASVPFEYQDLTDPKVLLNSMLQYEAWLGTNYDSAITKAGSLIEAHFDSKKTNVIIFLSDGECYIPTNQLHAICKQNKEKGSPLYLYTVLFGSDSHSGTLEEMAKIAQSYHPQNSSSDSLRCQFTRVNDANKLVIHFTNVAESLRKHKPSLLKKV
ncbi:hypothetical protein RhiirA1_440393 [Rhizophagus irregularis]|uniref:VWFA domain-containing protein n=1 Tax=Rhizophagus irregularis TaxID=588596 RepID=A0A2N0RZU6_9GLOM|nr:hypothetical protein RhiirA1_440393 [Rhizophagus irregularis]